MRQTRTFIVATLAALGQASLAVAQIPEKPGMPASPASSPLMTYGLIILLVAIVCAGAMKAAKRTHQD